MTKPQRSVPSALLVLVAAAGAIGGAVSAGLAGGVQGFWPHLAAVLLAGAGVGLLAGVMGVIIVRSRRR